MQLQEYVVRQEQLELKYRPVVQQLPHIQQQLRAEELSQAAEFALSEGMRQPIMQVRSLATGSLGARSTRPIAIHEAACWLLVVVTQHLQLLRLSNCCDHLI